MVHVDIGGGDAGVGGSVGFRVPKSCVATCGRKTLLDCMNWILGLRKGPRIGLYKLTPTKRIRETGVVVARRPTRQCRALRNGLHDGVDAHGGPTLGSSVF